jgi:hypothetical protein
MTAPRHTFVPHTDLRLNQLDVHYVVEVTWDFAWDHMIAYTKGFSDLGSWVHMATAAEYAKDSRLAQAVVCLMSYARDGSGDPLQVSGALQRIRELIDPIRTEYLPVPLLVVVAAAQARMAVRDGREVPVEGLAALASVDAHELLRTEGLGWLQYGGVCTCEANHALQYLRGRDVPGFADLSPNHPYR